jgi:predicted ester cyclase
VHRRTIAVVEADPETVASSYFQRLLVERDLDVCDELLAAGYVDHDAPVGSPPGPAATRAYVEAMLADHPDLRFEIEELIAQGSAVALRATWRGTHAVTGEPLRQRGLVFLHVDATGRITERWSAYAPLES